MISNCTNGTQQKKIVGDDKNDTDNTDFNPANFLSVTYENETYVNENISFTNFIDSTAVKDVCNATINGDDEKYYFKGKEQRRRHRLATPKTPLQSNEGKTSKMKHLNSEPAHYSCTFCDKYFFQRQLWQRHMKLHTTVLYKNGEQALDKDIEENEYVCEKCGIDCKYKAVHIQHQKLHKKKEKQLLSCNICRKEFRFNSLLLHHIESHKIKSKVKKSLSCHICGKKYTKSGSLTKHELQHEGKGSYRCRPCGEAFATETERTKHRNEKHEKLWKCLICSHMFATVDKLNSHMKWHESKETEVFICNVCGKEFKLKVNLKIHVESRCGTDPQHVCKVCGKAFMTRGTLVTHSLLHTGEKTFLCRFCGKNFRLKVEMQRHERSHTGEKPFICKVCNKAFAHRESLVTHNTLHTGIRPYMCEACGSTFSCIGNLIKHRKTHRNRCALVSPSTTPRKSKTKLKCNRSQSHEKNNIMKNNVVLEQIITPVMLNIQKAANNVNQEVTPFLPGNCCNYRNSGYEENHDWMSSVFGNIEQTSERLSETNERFHSVGDLHFGNMEGNVRSSQFYWGNSNIMGLHTEPIQSFGMYGTVPKESKIDATTRSLPYRCPTDELMANNEKPAVNNSFQNSDNHRLQNYCTEKYSRDNMNQEKHSSNHKAANDTVQQSHFKLSDCIASNTVSLHTGSGYESECGNPISQAVASVNTSENVTNCKNHMASKIDAANLVTNHHVANDATNFDDKHNNALSNPFPETESQETDDESNFGSPINNSLETELSEAEDADVTTPEILMEYDNEEKLKTQRNVKLERDDEKTVFQPVKEESLEKISCERKQKYPFKCDVKSDEKLIIVLDSECADNHVEIQFLCVMCGSEFAQKHMLNEHMQSHSDISHKELASKRSELDDSDMVSDDEPLDKRLERHLKKLEIFDSNTVPKKFLCQYCNKYFEFVSQLNRHRKCHSSEEKEATPCCHCGKKYTNRACLIKHESQHTGVGVFKCKQCGDGFNAKQEYRSHRTKMHGKQWSCSECHRSFSNSSNLKNHYNNKHLGQEASSYACNICGKLFKQKGNLKVHVDSRCGSEPRHVCNICGKAFMSGGSLSTHLLLHTGEKTFLCRFCGKSYRLKVEMQRHERSHTGEKPFVCKVCNKAFAHRESLVTHNTLHTGIRPYMCEACGSTFSCIGNLIKHRQTHNRRCDIARQ